MADSVTINAGTPEQVAYNLMIFLFDRSQHGTEEGTLQLYQRCLNTVKGIRVTSKSQAA